MPPPTEAEFQNPRLPPARLPPGKIVTGIDPEFYSFTRTLEIYNESLDKDSSLILSTDSEFLKYFKGYSQELIR